MSGNDAGAGSVRKSITVNAAPERAFRVFTTRMGAWWPKANSIGSGPQADVIVEPGVGGRWYEVAEDGSECSWGKVLVWEPPHRLVLAWQINGEWRFDDSLVTEVELNFTEVEGGRTQVDLEHRDLERFGPARDGIRAAFDSPNGWSGILRSYAATAES